MPFKKIKYNSGREIFHLKVQDPTGAVLDKWVVMKDDFNKMVDIIKKKYGLKGKKISEEDDLSWIV